MPSIVASVNNLSVFGHLTVQALYTESGAWYVRRVESRKGSTGRFLDMAIDNIHTLARLDLKIIEALIEKYCTAGKKEWLACFVTDKDGKGTFNLDAADVCFERHSMPQG